ncbi:Uncharacterized protein conserved in cyanobacteria [Gloeomargarita lithophora Alchichica-D10]|uniref:Uncharacterized protein conserved in cyanobacteria n=1 Tax=Gloeomargarita lithophora Alchichica-D10 TaxID=1188229 RepID=A0A1J0AAH9_9CYAN|nr:Uma2 family endonuclease [Gloeomargarita lithophora]APB32935.1 Uncharacterized protein conserved in cyanobacteria [Gloeomargarita lithophora Alchichica-D10]
MRVTSTIQWISADLELLPENSNRYEIIDGELFVNQAPHWFHQRVCGNLYLALTVWGIGYAAIGAGIVWGESDDVIPDVVWLRSENYEQLLDESGHLRGSPDLIIEVLSPGTTNERRDKEVKLKLYSTRGVKEYWIID